MRTFPDFGKGLSRPFEVDERSYDCAEFYYAGHAHPENPDARCADYLRLPDVKPGTTGQVIPPSRMGDRKEPRIRLPAAARTSNPTPTQTAKPPIRRRTPAQTKPADQPPVESSQQPDQPQPQDDAEPDNGRTRQQSPAAVPGPDGQRSCTCGALLRKRERCCTACRISRRKETLHRRRNGKHPLVASGSDSDVLFTHEIRPSTPCRSGAHN